MTLAFFGGDSSNATFVDNDADGLADELTVFIHFDVNDWASAPRAVLTENAEDWPVDGYVDLLYRQVTPPVGLEPYNASLDSEAIDLDCNFAVQEGANGALHSFEVLLGEAEPLCSGADEPHDVDGSIRIRCEGALGSNNGMSGIVDLRILF